MNVVYHARRGDAYDGPAAKSKAIYLKSQFVRAPLRRCRQTPGRTSAATTVDRVRLSTLLPRYIIRVPRATVVNKNRPPLLPRRRRRRIVRPAAAPHNGRTLFNVSVHGRRGDVPVCAPCCYSRCDISSRSFGPPFYVWARMRDFHRVPHSDQPISVRYAGVRTTLRTPPPVRTNARADNYESSSFLFKTNEFSRTRKNPYGREITVARLTGPEGGSKNCPSI